MLNLEGELSRHEGWMTRLALRLVHDEHQARDLVQDAFLRVLVNPPRNHAPMRGWLWRTLYRLGIDEARKERLSHLSEDDRHTVQGAALNVELVEARTTLGRELLDLPPIQRDILTLRFQDKMSGRDVARKLQIPEVKVRRETQRGLEALRSRLRSKFGGDWANCLAPLLWPLRTLRIATVASSGVGLLGLLAALALVAMSILGFGGAVPAPSVLTAGLSAGPTTHVQERESLSTTSSPKHPDVSMGRSDLAKPTGTTSPPGTEPVANSSSSQPRATTQAALSSGTTVSGRLLINGLPGKGWKAQIRPVQDVALTLDRSPVSDDGMWSVHTDTGEAQELWLINEQLQLQATLPIHPGQESRLNLGRMNLRLAPLLVRSEQPHMFVHQSVGGAQVTAFAQNKGGQVSFPMAPLGTLSVLGAGEGFNPSTWPVLGYVTNTEDPLEVVGMHE